jgi:thymidylate synthase
MKEETISKSIDGGSVHDFNLNRRVAYTDPRGSFSQLYPYINRVMCQLPWQNSRGGKVRELLDVKTVITNPYRRCVGGYGRNINVFFLLAEAMWIAAGRKDVEFLTIFNSRMADFSDNGETFHAPYGWRLRHWGIASESESADPGLDQVAEAVRLLSADPDTRQVVMSIWNPKFDLGVKTKDLPCNDMVMLKIRDGKLVTTIQNRSNDLHWGLPTNIFQFSFLTEIMSLCLGVELGVQTHNSQSLHVYEWSDVAEKMNDFFAKDVYTPGSAQLGLYNEAISYMMDFNFESEVPVNRLREITVFLEEMITRLLNRNTNGGDPEDEAGYQRYVHEKSIYFSAVYQLLKEYIFYKANRGGCLPKDRDQLLKGNISIVDYMPDYYQVDARWDYLMLARNFFAARLSNADPNTIL